MSHHNIVVWDPKGEYWEGSLVDEARARQLSLRDAVVLPTNAALHAVSGVGGYAKRAWGSGWPLDFAAPKNFCPLTLFVPAGDGTTLYWAARLMPMSPGARPLDGSIRIAADSTQHNPYRLGLIQDGVHKASVETRELKDVDAQGGWCVGGRVKARAPMEAHYPLSLHGAMPGARVVWVAVSLA
jgi:hypothetical protein